MNKSFITTYFERSGLGLPKYPGVRATDPNTGMYAECDDFLDIKENKFYAEYILSVKLEQLNNKQMEFDFV